MTKTEEAVLETAREFGWLMDQIAMAKNDYLFERRFDTEKTLDGAEGFLGVFRFGEGGGK